MMKILLMNLVMMNQKVKENKKQDMIIHYRFSQKNLLNSLEIQKN